MSNYFRYLNLPYTFINLENLLNETKEVTEKCVCGSSFWPGKWDQEHEIFSNDFRVFLKKHNISVLKTEAFNVFPYSSLAWHNDSNDDFDDLEFHETAKINFMWGKLNQCFMQYGELTEEVGRRIILNRRGRKAYVYDPKYIKVIEEFSLEKPVLINRGPCHRVTNKSNRPWLCLSCVIFDNNTNKCMTFKEATQKFSEYVVD
jgi:hypothetical protein